MEEGMRGRGGLLCFPQIAVLLLAGQTIIWPGTIWTGEHIVTYWEVWVHLGFGAMVPRITARITKSGKQIITKITKLLYWQPSSWSSFRNSVWPWLWFGESQIKSPCMIRMLRVVKDDALPKAISHSTAHCALLCQVVCFTLLSELFLLDESQCFSWGLFWLFAAKNSWGPNIKVW